jgi:hypothetical protein
LLASGLLVLGGAVLCRALVESGLVRVEVFVLLLLVALVLLRRSDPAVLVNRGEADVLVPLDWLAGLQACHGPVRVRSLELFVRLDWFSTVNRPSVSKTLVFMRRFFSTP